MTATGPGSTMYTLFEGRRPSPIQPPPSGGEIKKLRERLLKYAKESGGSLTPAACEFLAGAVVSPSALRQQLSRPTLRPTATGYLEVIYATVSIDCLAPDPTNGRVVGATAWPASDLNDGQTLKLWAPADMTAHPDSGCEVLLTSDSLATIKTVEDAAEHTKKLNREMKEKIQHDGILDPLLCQITHIQTMDGEQGIALVTRDGSTRCSYAKEAHRSPAHDAFFGSVRDIDVRRTRWQEMRRRTERPVDAISIEELIELRTFLVDVQIVIGFHTDDPRVTALDAVDDIVRRTHVEVTHPWLPVARSNSEADQMLAVLRARDVLTHDQFLLYGGKLPRSARAARGMPVEPDAVVAELMLSLGATESRRAALDDLHATMRSVDGRGQIRNRYKAALVGALGLRQFQVDSRSLESAHLALGEALSLDCVWEGKWKNTSRSPDALRDAALGELAADGRPGPACRELLVKAAGHMTAQGWLKRESRDPSGGFRDQRPPDTVLDLMHREPQGVHALAEALAAGRRGVEGRAVREDGAVIERVAGDTQPIDNQWLRKTFAAPADREKAPALAAAAASTGPTTPREQVAVYMREMDRLAGDLERSLESAQRVADDNGRFLDRRGWTLGEAEPLAERLRALGNKLSRYGLIADVNPALPPVQDDLFSNHQQAA